MHCFQCGADDHLIFQCPVKPIQGGSNNQGSGAHSPPPVTKVDFSSMRRNLKPSVQNTYSSSVGQNDVIIQQKIQALKPKEQLDSLQSLVRDVGLGKKRDDEGSSEIRLIAERMRATRKHEVNQKVKQAMSGMAQVAWNNSYSWRARFAMHFVDNEVIIEIRALLDGTTLGTNNANQVMGQWGYAIKFKWQKLAFVWKETVSGTDKFFIFPLRVMMTFTDNKLNAHCGLKANDPSNIGTGTSGVGGTKSMTVWGTGDPTDIPHEVGHMLGAVDNYGTIVVNDDNSHPESRDWPKGRVTGLGVMNNPAEDPKPQSLWLPKRELPKLMAKLGRVGIVEKVTSLEKARRKYG